MTILEKRSAARVKALIRLVEKGEYVPEYALIKLDELNERGLITAADYDSTFDYLVNLMEEDIEEDNEIAEENIEEIAESEE